MNFQQLEYIIALDKHRNFVKASESCFVTQPTLSAMVQKLEDELGVKVFDRSRHPIVPTYEGEVVLGYARQILHKSSEMKDSVSRLGDEPEGSFKLGIIPTVATSLLPVFLASFLKRYPRIDLHISELTTATIIEKLDRDELDAGIIATPAGSVSLVEYPVYREEFLLYGGDQFPAGVNVCVTDINPGSLWLLEEGHCLRMQVVNLCDMRDDDSLYPNLHYQAGSLESLRRLVDANGGYTVLPALSVIDLTDDQKNKIRKFKPPVPARQISVVTMRQWKRRTHIGLLVDAIKTAVDGLGIAADSDMEVIAVPDMVSFKGRIG
jgi:LysR family hydrogen peroxide-inducible transcriptional activator